MPGGKRIPFREEDRDKYARIMVHEMFQLSALTDAEGYLLEVNQPAIDGSGLRREDVIGKQIWTVPAWETDTETPKKVERAMMAAARGEFYRDEIPILAGGGGKFAITVDFSAKPIRDESGEIRYLIAEGRNISEKKEAEQKLRETERLKDEFFANVSHELRTPLTLILAPLETLLSRGNSHPDDVPFLRTMHNNCIRLLQMITGLLDYSRLQAGRIELKRETVDAVKLSQSVLTDFGPLMERKGLAVEFHCSENAPNVELDRYLFERILFNLLSNACKFTEKGGRIAVGLSFADNRLRLAVKDSGIGMPEEAIPGLFERFHQLQGSSTRRFEGTGLGLALVKEFAELLGGSIRATSRLGAGSEFVLECDAPVSQQAVAASPTSKTARWVAQHTGTETAATPRPSRVKKLKVLMAEDNIELAGYIRSLLEETCDFRLAKDGQEALSLFQSWTPDLVLSDVMMPGMDGFDLCRAIKADKHFGETPVILLTALTHRDALLKGWEAGADDYLFKPFHPAELFTRVNSFAKLIGARTARETEKRRRQELEDFAYIASHDLSEPARVMRIYSQILRSKCGEKLSAEEGELVSYISDSAARMQQLIESLAVYSTVTREDQLVEIDASEALSRALENLKLMITETGAEISYGPLPILRASPVQLIHVFQNFISNALKYRRTGVVPRIRIDTADVNNEWRFSISDNGIGFDAKYADQIFLIFKRLHTAQEYPGSGMGLSICRSIVNKHGGRTWAQSDPEKGSVFYFTIPKESNPATP